MWTLSKDNRVTKSTLTIQGKKFMVTLIWNPGGFYAVDRVPDDIKMRSAYFVTNVFIPLIPLE
jgi:hypothetical protein